MKDEFELPGSTTDGGNETHTHFCMLHATAIVLEAGVSLPLHIIASELEVTLVFRTELIPRLVYHPPVVS
jgi:hypothetical protein